MVYFLGVDVGTASVRVGLFAEDGNPVGVRTKEISISNPKKDFYEQSSTEIWAAICTCIDQLVKENCDDKSLLKREDIVSIGITLFTRILKLVREVSYKENTSHLIIRIRRNLLFGCS